MKSIICTWINPQDVMVSDGNYQNSNMDSIHMNKHVETDLGFSQAWGRTESQGD